MGDPRQGNFSEFYRPTDYYAALPRGDRAERRTTREIQRDQWTEKKTWRLDREGVLFCSFSFFFALSDSEKRLGTRRILSRQNFHEIFVS